MARGRFLNASIAADIELNSLSLEAHWLYMMTIPHLDRDGLIIADTYVFFGKVCPRRPELIPSIDALIGEWVQAGLVTVYPTRDGKVAFFHGFTKNQQGMHYGREGASALQPPPGYVRTSTGLHPDNDPGNDAPRKPSPDPLPTNSGLTPAEVKDQLEVEGKAEAEGAAPAAAADYDPDVARIWAKWDANMPGVRTEVITNSVNSLLDDYSAAEIEEAISIACKRNRRNLSYIQGILAKGAFSEAPAHANGNGYSGGKPSGLDVFKEYARKNGVAI